MAFKMRSPLHNKSPYKLDLQSAFKSDDDKADTKEKEVEDETGEMVEDEGESNAEKYQQMMDQSESGYSDNPFLRGRIDVARNKAQEARLKGRLDKRLKRQEKRVEKQEERAENPMKKARKAIRETIKADRADARDERRVTRAAEKLTKFDPTMSDDMIDNVVSTPAMAQPNRAGRPINSNMLMTSPVIKTGKHSAKDAVAKLRMRKIAQSE